MVTEADSARSWLLPVEGEFATFSSTLYRVLFWQSARVVWDQIIVNHDGEESIREQIARREITTYSLARYPIVDAPKWGPVHAYRRVFRADGDRDKVIAHRFDGESPSPSFPDRDAVLDDLVQKLASDELISTQPMSTQELMAVLAAHRQSGDIRHQVDAIVHDLASRDSSVIIAFAKALGQVLDERQQTPIPPEVEGELSPSTVVFAIAWSLLRDKPIDRRMLESDDWMLGELLLNAATTAYFDLTGEPLELDPEFLALLDNASTDEDPPLAPEPAPGSLATPEKTADWIAQWGRTLERQRNSPGAPLSLRDGDPWWEPTILRRWYAVRLLFAEGDYLTEDLWLISLPDIRPYLPLPPGIVSARAEVDSFIQWRAANTPGELLRSEVTNMGWHQNDVEVLNLKRRFSGTVEEYAARYVESDGPTP